MRESIEVEVTTQKNLIELEKRLNEGWNRSIIRKEEMKQHAQGTLQGFESVLKNHKYLEQLEENERL